VIILLLKGGLIQALLSSPRVWKGVKDSPQAQMKGVMMIFSLGFLSGCTRVHPPNVAPKLTSEL
jgi:hypothetical protein